MIKKLVIIGLIYYVYRQSQTSGMSFVDTAAQDIQNLLGQIEQVNPPQPLQIGASGAPFSTFEQSRFKTDWGGTKSISGGYRLVK